MITYKFLPITYNFNYSNLRTYSHQNIKQSSKYSLHTSFPNNILNGLVRRSPFPRSSVCIRGTQKIFYKHTYYTMTSIQHDYTDESASAD